MRARARTRMWRCRYYTEGLDERCNDPSLNASLLANRGAAHTMIKNYGKALADAAAALDSGYLPVSSMPKVCRRGAAAALVLEKVAEAERLIIKGEQAVAAAAAAAAAPAPAPEPAPAATRAPPSSAVGTGEVTELAKLRHKLETLREEKARRELEARAKAHVEQVTKQAVNSI